MLVGTNCTHKNKIKIELQKQEKILESDNFEEIMSDKLALFACLVAALALRLVLHAAAGDWLQSRVELVTPGTQRWLVRERKYSDAIRTQ